MLTPSQQEKAQVFEIYNGGVVYSEGDTAAHLACRSGNREIIRLLVENKADLNRKNHNDETAMEILENTGTPSSTETIVMIAESQQKMAQKDNKSEKEE